MEKPPEPVHRIVKFGGTSVEGAERVDLIAQVVRDRIAAGLRPVVVVSAYRGVTDLLGRAAAEAADGAQADATATVATLRERHLRAIEETVGGGGAAAPSLHDLVDDLLDELGRVLQGIALLGECTPRTLDQVLSIGERLSGPIIAAGLRARGVEAEVADPCALLLTDERFGAARIDEEATERAVSAHFDAASATQVVPGFVAATRTGEVTTLGRGGSDHTAAILGAALGADEVEIWTDVDGVMSADPRVAPAAFPLSRLSYDELLELSHWGARVMHAPAVRPLRERRIPIVIRNARNPAFPGTRVNGETGEENGPVKGISSIDEIAILTLRGYGVIGTPGVVERLFSALGRAGGNALLVIQASSERSICVGLRPDGLDAATRVVAEEFTLERRAGILQDPEVERGYSVVSAVGEGMRELPGVAGRIFSILGNHGINVRAIAQGPSELNITAVVRRDAVGLAVRAIHDAFFHPEPRRAHVYLVGVGRVGSALLDQLSADGSNGPLAEVQRLRLAGVATTDRAQVDRAGIDLQGLGRMADGSSTPEADTPEADTTDPDTTDPDRWRACIPSCDDSLDTLVEAALRDPHHPRIFVDCTASDAPVGAYEHLLDAGVTLVCANKRGFSSSTEAYRRLKGRPDADHRIYHETTVGAALPLIRTLADLVRTGDQVHRIEGVLSGTLGYLLDRLHSGAAFSAAVREAYDLGYTEPDPRDDLGGIDVLRKLVILAREGGMTIEPEEVSLEPMLPGEGWGEIDPDGFWARLPEVDEVLAERAARAAAEGRRLVYLASVADGSASVRIEEVEADHPCAALRGTDNLVAIWSDRYRETPLVVRGPGAGPEVTASGVFADILRARAEAAEVAPPLRRRPSSVRS